MSYTSYDHDRLEAAEKLKIERTIYFQSEKSDIAELTALPLAELIRRPPYSIPLTNGRSATTTAAKSVTRYIE